MATRVEFYTCTVDLFTVNFYFISSITTVTLKLKNIRDIIR